MSSVSSAEVDDGVGVVDDGVEKAGFGMISTWWGWVAKESTRTAV